MKKLALALLAAGALLTATAGPSMALNYSGIYHSGFPFGGASMNNGGW